MRYAARRLFQNRTPAERNSENNLKTNVLSCIVKIFVFACNQSKVTDATHQPEVNDG